MRSSLRIINKKNPCLLKKSALWYISNYLISDSYRNFSFNLLNNNIVHTSNEFLNDLIFEPVEQGQVPVRRSTNTYFIHFISQVVRLLFLRIHK